MLVNDFIGAEIATHSSGGRANTFLGWAMLQLGRMRFQVMGGFIVSVAAPAVIIHRMSLADALDFQKATLIGTLSAFLLGYFFFRKLTAYPGVRATAYILPAFLTAYALVGGMIMTMRLEYSVAQFGVSFVLCTTFCYLVLFLSRRSRVLELAIIPVGDFRRLFQLRFVNWRTISTPDQGEGRTPLVVDLRAELSPAWERFVTESALSGRPVYNAKQVFESLSGRVFVEHLSENTFGSLMPNSIYASAKRHCDFVSAFFALVCLLPFMVLIGCVIRVDTPGPALFRQRRMGFGGREFTVFKFRTMRVSDDLATSNSEMTQANDSRITRVGKFLRKMRIDELPQLLNVLRGEMSWIGPRPEALNLARLYETKLPFYTYRHLVRPGITGWAQVNQGHITSIDDADLKLQYDFFYVKNFSLWLDILVLLRTVRVVVTGHGAK